MLPIVPSGYGLQFYAHYGAIDLTSRGLGKGKNYGCFFYRKGFAGTSIKLRTGGDPCKIDTPNDTLPGLKPRKASFELLSTSDTQLKDFFVIGDQDVFVLVTDIDGPNDDQGTIHFVGYVSPWDAQEEYATAPYKMEFSAVDGLGFLASFPYLQYPSGLPFPGKRTIYTYIRTSLLWLGYELPLWFSMHLAEEANWGPANSFGISQHPGVWFDAFTVNKVNANLWLTDKGDYLSCKQVLEDLCKTFRLRLVQEEGVWKFLCVDELPGLPNLDGSNTRERYWNAYDIPVGSAAPLKHQISEDPIKTVYKLKGQFVPRKGAKVGIQQPKLRYKMTLDYGALNSQIANGGFIGVAGQVPQGWTRNSPIDGSGVIVGSGLVDDPYFLVIKGLKNGDPKKAYFTDQRYLNVVYQTVVEDLKPGAQRKLNLSGLCVNDKTKGAAMEVVAVLGYLDESGVFHAMPTDNITGSVLGNSYALQSTGEWGSKKKGETVNYLHFDNIVIDPLGPVRGKTMYVSKPTAGESFSLSSKAIPYTPFPGAGKPLIQGAPKSDYPTAVQVTLTLWPGPDFDARTHDGATTKYRNVQISFEDGAYIDLDKEVVFVEVANLLPQARKKTENIDLTLGDQTTALGIPSKPIRPAALLRADESPTSRWMMAYGGHVDKIQQQVARNTLIGTQRPMKLFIGQLLGEPSVIDVMLCAELENRNLFALTHTWDMRMRTVDTRAVELPNDLDRLMDVVVDGRFETKDGAVYPMGAGASTPAGTYVIPTVPSIQRTDPIDVLTSALDQKTRVPIDPQFTDVGIVPQVVPALRFQQFIDPQFEVIN